MLHALSPALMAMLDGVGSFVFALSGGLLAVQKRFDLFGVLVLSFVVAVTGGITRDVLIGAVPPASVASWHTSPSQSFRAVCDLLSLPGRAIVQPERLVLRRNRPRRVRGDGSEKALQYVSTQ